MSLPFKAFVPTTVPGKLVLAALTLFLATMPAHAQPPGGSPRVSPDARGYQRTMVYQQHYQHQAATAHTGVAHPTYHRPAEHPTEAPTALQVVVKAPTTYVTLRGPNGEVRRFPLVGGREAIQVRSVIVRPGQTVHITIMAKR